MKKVVLSVAALMCGTFMFAQVNLSDVNQSGNHVVPWSNNREVVTTVGLYQQEIETFQGAPNWDYLQLYYRATRKQ